MVGTTALNLEHCCPAYSTADWRTFFSVQISVSSQSETRTLGPSQRWRTSLGFGLSHSRSPTIAPLERTKHPDEHGPSFQSDQPPAADGCTTLRPVDLPFGTHWPPIHHCNNQKKNTNIIIKQDKIECCEYLWRSAVCTRKCWSADEISVTTRSFALHRVTRTLSKKNICFERTNSND